MDGPAPRGAPLLHLLIMMEQLGLSVRAFGAQTSLGRSASSYCGRGSRGMVFSQWKVHFVDLHSAGVEVALRHRIHFGASVLARLVKPCMLSMLVISTCHQRLQ